MISRRGFLTYGAAAIGAAAATVMRQSSKAVGEATVQPPAYAGPQPLPFQDIDGIRHFSLKAAVRPFQILDAPLSATPLWTYADTLFPVLRVKQNMPVRAVFENALPEHSSIHWHGIRLQNAMDGVPFITQKPVMTGESFVYEFTPPDAGTYFIHPHCNEPGQVGQGMAGVLIVEGDEPDGAFDGEIILAVKDWRLDEKGAFLPFITDKGASRAGTFGTVKSVNGVRVFRTEVPASANLRVRILNVDATRVLQIGVEGAEAFVIAIDGNAVAPFKLDVWRLGPAMRLDLAIRSPRPGGTAKVISYFGSNDYVLAELQSAGPSLRSPIFEVPKLITSPIPEPDLNNAETQTYLFGAATDAIASFIEKLDRNDPYAEQMLDSLCVGQKTFWAINKLSWPNDGHRTIPPPLAKLTPGKSYRFTLQNTTPHPHPIHLHGHTFKVLSASERSLPVHYADTVLVMPNERVEIAFVAREGNWMFHCHILEHLETGMMGYFQVA